jgi:hypothetical protein
VMVPAKLQSLIGSVDPSGEARARGRDAGEQQHYLLLFITIL